jgi:hypothetical protein
MDKTQYKKLLNIIIKNQSGDRYGNSGDRQGDYR